MKNLNQKTLDPAAIMASLLALIGFLSFVTGSEAQETNCTITHHICVENTFYGRTNPAKINQGVDCLWSNEKITFNHKDNVVTHSKRSSSGLKTELHNIKNVKEGAYRLLTVTYASEMNFVSASIGYSRDGGKVTSFSSANLTYDGFPSISLGICDSDLTYSDWLSE